MVDVSTYGRLFTDFVIVLLPSLSHACKTENWREILWLCSECGKKAWFDKTFL